MSLSIRQQRLYIFKRVGNGGFENFSNYLYTMLIGGT